MVTPFEKLLVREQQVALVSVLAARMSEAGMLSDSAAAMKPSEIAALVMDGAAAESGSDAVRKALVFKVAEIVESVTNMVRGAAVKSAPVARRAGKVTADVAAAAGEFVFQTTKEAVRKMSGPVYGPPCPVCGARTVIRRNKKTHMPFAACSSWEDTGCNFTAGVTFTDD